MTRRIEELEGKLTDLQKSSSGESSQLRGELSDAVQENIKLLDEQTKAVKESIKIRDDLVRFTNENILLKNEMSRLTNENTGLTIADQNKTAEIQILRRELVDLKKEMDSLEKARNDLQENVLFLQKDLAAKVGSTNNKSIQLNIHFDFW
jgi:predicted  nucleic acid-binding Zn-ribbon protein